MGGSGNYGIGGDRAGGQIGSCENLVIEATLNSPQQGILEQLSTGTILQIALNEDGTVIVMYKESILGSLAGLKISKLVACLDNGFSFEAEITFIDGGKCDLRVYAS